VGRSTFLKFPSEFRLAGALCRGGMKRFRTRPCVDRVGGQSVRGSLYDDDMTNDELFAGTAVKNWRLVIDRLTATAATLSDEGMQKEVSPGRNRVYYLIGHLTAVHDRMLPLLGLGERLHPELDDQFITKPDRTLPDTVAADDLRKAFAEV